MEKSIKELKHDLFQLKNVWRHPAILELRDKILEENRPMIEKLEKEIILLQSKRPSKKPRFPENVPQNVLDVCNKYWSGTTEYDTFRIHVWNDKAVWTSWPSGGYYTNAGYNPAAACFFLISLKDNEEFGGNRPKRYLEVKGRNSEKKLRGLLEEYTK